jgi:hypothetical protein
MSDKTKRVRMYADVMFLDPDKIDAARAAFVAEGFTFESQPWRVAENFLTVWARVATDWDGTKPELIRRVGEIAEEYRDDHAEDYEIAFEEVSELCRQLRRNDVWSTSLLGALLMHASLTAKRIDLSGPDAAQTLAKLVASPPEYICESSIAMLDAEVHNYLYKLACDDMGIEAEIFFGSAEQAAAAKSALEATGFQIEPRRPGEDGTVWLMAYGWCPPNATPAKMVHELEKLIQPHGGTIWELGPTGEAPPRLYQMMPTRDPEQPGRGND